MEALQVGLGREGCGNLVPYPIRERAMLVETRRKEPDAPNLSRVLADYARKLERLSPSSRHPERYHEDKSEIVAGLRRLAREVRHG